MRPNIIAAAWKVCGDSDRYNEMTHAQYKHTLSLSKFKKNELKPQNLTA
jgi:hypothetical protein